MEEETIYNAKRKAGRPRSNVVRRVFSVYATDNEKVLIRAILGLSQEKYVTDEDLKVAKRFFNRVKGRWSNV